MRFLEEDLKNFADLIVSDAELTPSNHVIIIEEDLQPALKELLSRKIGKKRTSGMRLESVRKALGHRAPPHIEKRVFSQASSIYSDAGYSLPKQPIDHLLVDDPEHPLSRLVTTVLERESISRPQVSTDYFGEFVSRVYLFDAKAAPRTLRNRLGQSIPCYVEHSLTIDTVLSRVTCSVETFVNEVLQLSASSTHLIVPCAKTRAELEKSLLQKHVPSNLHSPDSIQCDPTIPHLSTLAAYIQSRQPRYLSDLYHQLFKRDLKLHGKSVLQALLEEEDPDSAQFAELIMACEFSTEPLITFLSWLNDTHGLTGPLYRYIRSIPCNQAKNVLDVLLDGNPPCIELLLPSISRTLPTEHLVTCFDAHVPDDAIGRYPYITCVELTHG